MIRLRILGPLELRGADGTEMRSLLAQPKRTALLAYLAAEGARGFQRRDTLLGLFWPEFDEGRARAALSRALHFLRQGLGDDVVVARGEGELSLNGERLWCDVAALERAREVGDHAAVLELYRGPLLEGFFLEEVPEFERWVERERRRLRLAASAAAGALAEAREREGELAGAVAAARLGVELDECDEVALRRLLLLLDRAGDRAGAVAAYDRVARRIGEELHVEPSAETRALVERIRLAGAEPRPARAPSPPPAAPPAADPGAESPRLPEPAGVARAPARPPSDPVVPALSPEVGLAPRLAARRSWRRWTVAAAVAVVTALFVLAAALRSGGERGLTGSASRSRVVAVLPFADVSERHDQAYFSDGLTDELIAELGTIRGLDVVARTSSFAFKGTSASVEEIARRLRATHVLEGSVRRDGGRLRVNVQLVDARTGYRVWSRAFDERTRDVFAVQGDISRAVAAALEPRLGGARAAGGGRRASTVDPAAHDHYLQGRYLYFSAGMWDSVQNVRAAEAFGRAIARDSAYAAAWAGLADVLGRTGKMREAREAARRALALDPQLSDAYASLAYVLANGEWRWAEAVRAADRAVALNPASVPALQRRAEILSVLGRDAEAIADIERAYRLDPLSPSVNERRGAVYLAADRWDDAIRILRTVVAARPENADAREMLALAYLGKGMGAAAAAEFLAAHGDTVSAAIARKDRPAMLRFVREGEAQPEGRLTPLAMATLYAHLGRPDDAFAMLERARGPLHGYPWGVGVVEDPRLLPLRAHPRYAPLRERWMAP